MSEEIKPCPFCGSEMVEIHWTDKTICFIECVECEARTGEIEGGDEAIDLWNQRPYDYDMPAIVKKVQELQYDLSEALTVLQTTLTLNPNAINDINKKVLEKHKRFDVFTEAGF